MTDAPSPPTTPPAAFAPGFVVGGRYELTARIAMGGMAEVWEAHDRTLERRVAVKLLLPALATDPAFRDRFRTEAVAAARLVHPNIVAIYDTCPAGDTEAIVMELVRGRTLRQLLNEEGALTPPEAVRIAADVAGALEVAHRSGVVHRDIKPGNILLGVDQRVLVADFGIAKAQDRGDLTHTGTMLGTVKYLAPEQVEGTELDGRTDLYALGIVLYECLCGRVPFQADTDAATALARLHKNPVPPRELKPGIPADLDRVVLRMLARDRAARFVDAAATRAALLAVRFDAHDAHADRTVAVRAPLPAPAPAARPTPPTTAPTFRQTQRGWFLPTLLILLIAVALGTAGMLFGRTDAGHDLFEQVRDAIGSGDETTPTTEVGTSDDPGSPPSVVGVRDFDPFDPDGKGDEIRAKIQLAIDADQSTAWTTEGYNDHVLRKGGVGLYVTLSESTKVDRVEVDSPTVGWSAQLYIAEDAGATLAEWGEPVDEKSGDGNLVFDTKATEGAAVLLWITDVGSRAGDDGRFRTEIREIRIIPAS